jgi:hypothetical protein
MAIKSNATKVPVAHLELKLPSAGITYGPDFPDTVTIKPFSIRTEAVLNGNTGALEKMQAIATAVASFGSAGYPSDMLVADQYFVLAVARALTYGENYEFSTKCPACGATERVSLKVPEHLPVRVWDKSKPPTLSVKLPHTKDVVEFRYITVSDEIAIQQYEKQLRNAGGDGPAIDDMVFVRRQSKQIVSVNGGKPDDIAEADAYASSITGADMAALQDAIDANLPGIQYRWKLSCDKCGHKYETFIPITQDFFRRNRG